MDSISSSLIFTNDRSTDAGQPGIAFRGSGRFRWLFAGHQRDVSWQRRADLGRASQRGGSLASSVGQPTEFQRLQSPCDFADEPRAVAGPRFVEPQFLVADPQLVDRHGGEIQSFCDPPRAVAQP